MFRFGVLDLLRPVVLSFADVTGGASASLIAVAALSLDESSEISVHAGHAPNFLLFDESGHLQRIIANPYANLHEEIGEEVADLLKEHEVRLMIAGDFGPHLAEVLDQRGIGHIKDVGLANIAVAAHRHRTAPPAHEA